MIRDVKLSKAFRTSAAFCQTHPPSTWKLTTESPRHALGLVDWSSSVWGRGVGYGCCDRKAQAACAQSFTLWLQARIEITRRSHSSSPSASTFNCSPGSQALLEATHQDHSIRITLLLLVCVTYIWVLFFAHIPFVVNHAFSASGEVFNASGEVATRLSTKLKV